MSNKLLPLICFLALLAGCSKNNNNSNLVTNPSYNVTTKADIQYGQNVNEDGQNQRLALDIYIPKGATAGQKYPLLVMAHGGVFLTGRKEGLSDLCSSIAENGFVTVSIDYRVGWNEGTRECDGDTASLNDALYRSMQDYNAALRFLVANAGKYNIDVNWVFMGGSSAGAVAALNTAYISDDYASGRFNKQVKKFGGLHDADNDLTDTYTIKGICSMWGAVIDSNSVSPANAIPMISFHGALDETIPVNAGNYANCSNYPFLYGSEFLYNRLTSYGVPVVAHILPDEGHDPDNTYNPDFVSENTVCFLNSLISKAPQKGLYLGLVNNCQ